MVKELDFDPDAAPELRCPYCGEPADVDIDRLVQERARLTSFHDTILDHAEHVKEVDMPTDSVLRDFDTPEAVFESPGFMVN